MKKTNENQNVIVNLNFFELNKLIRNDDKDHRLLGWNGIYDDNYSEINDEIILHRFAFLKGKMEAIDLLGKILDGINYCLSFEYFIEYKDKNYICNGSFFAGDFDIDNIYDAAGDDMSDEIKTEINNYAFKNCQEIYIECNKAIKYYKEYYTRLFDRGRTVK